MRVQNLFDRFKRNQLVKGYSDLSFEIRRDALIEQTRFVVFDSETTGFERNDQLVSLGGVEVINFGVNPTVLDQRYPNQITNESISIHEELPAANEQLKPLIDQAIGYFANAVLVGHQVDYDIRMFNRISQDIYPGFRLRNKFLDTFRLAKRLDPIRYERQVGGNSNLKLDDLCAEFEIPIEARHTALGDAFLTALVFLHLINRLRQRGIKKTSQLF